MECMVRLMHQTAHHTLYVVPQLHRLKLDYVGLTDMVDGLVHYDLVHYGLDQLRYINSYLDYNGQDGVGVPHSGY